MAEQLIKRFKYNDAKLHWETYVDRFMKSKKALISRCRDVGLKIEFYFNPDTSIMEVSINGDLDKRSDLIDEIKDIEF